MADRVCPRCSASYVDWVTVCSDCGVALVPPNEVADPRQLAEEFQLVYELESWTLAQRTAVAEAMAESGIPHGWDEADLVVHVDYEEPVDALLAPIEHASAPIDGDLGVPETEYDLADWSAEDRDRVVDLLVDAGVPHRWEEALLLVPQDEEDVVEDILDDVELGGDDAALEDDGRETPFAVMEGLFLAATRLRGDPLDADGLGHLATAMGDADPDRPPFGVDLRVWRRVMELSTATSEAIGGEDGPDVAAAKDHAHALHDALRDLV